MERKQIAQLVDRLDHPDSEQRRQAMRRLVDLSGEAVPVLEASLRLVEPEARRGLVRVLGQIGDDRALLPLMRFVFDERGSIEESDARGLAMQAIMKIAGPEHADKVFDFLIDMKEDEDAFVRGYVIEAFGRLDDRRAEPFVEEAMEDEDEFVRECAQRAKEALEGADSDVLESVLGDRDLLQKIRIAGGSELDYYMSELLDRQNAFELAVELVRSDNRQTARGLRALMKLDDPRAREVARRQFQSDESTTAKAICLRIMGDYLEGDATDEEVTIVRRALKHSDEFVALAALAAAGKTGDRGLLRKTIDAVESRDLSRAETAARSLSEGLTDEAIRLFPDLLDVFWVIHRHRRGDEEEEGQYARIEAYLLRAMGRLVSADGLGTGDAREAGLAALTDAADHRPILTTALTLLDRIVPDDGYANDAKRWAGVEIDPLLALLEHPEDAVARRALDLVERAVDPTDAEVADKLSRYLYADDETLIEQVIPLLEQSANSRARELLGELTGHSDDNVQQAADRALRHIRNADATIDVKYD